MCALPHRPWAAALRGAALLAPVLLGACAPGILDPRGPVGSAERTILIDSVAIMLAIVLPTILATLAVGWWFRAGNTRAVYTPDWAYSGRLELIVWSIPVLTVTLLGGVAWIGSHQLDPQAPLASKKPPLEIQGVSLDWKWLFIYPAQHVASVNLLVIPAGTPVHFSLTSGSVMSAFFVPQLGSMIYTMNGMVSRLNLQADAPGSFRGLSSHYNGDGFSGMHFETRAVPDAGFATWVENTKKSGPTLDTQAYQALAVQSMDVTPFTYHDVDSALFDKIATQKLPPGPGPQHATRNVH